MTLEPDEMAELDALDQAQEIVEEREPESVPCVFRTGKAGVGKTYWALRAVADNPRFGLLTATTGIAAVNLGAVTLNSRLGYFDTESLRDAYLTGRLASRLHELAREYSWLIIDEASMLGAGALDLLYKGVRDANRYSDVASPLGIALIGDFAQLPPVNEEWCFRAQCWPEFARGTVRMTEVFRQAEGPFLSALNLVREGHGGEAAEILSAAGARWNSARDDNFDGTTIVPVNQQVSRHNEVALLRVKGQTFTVASRRWGKERREWGLNPRTHEWGIPQQSEFRIGAYVMCLANASDFSVVNGDCGHIVEYSAHDRSVTIHLRRTGQDVVIAPIVRAVESGEQPDGWTSELRVPRGEDAGGWLARPHFRARARRYVEGQIEYYPLRLAYASSVHKSQSLTLDRLQVDFRHWFFGREAMLYVALSRCRTLEGLRLVGTRETFVKQCRMDAKVKEWL